MFYKVIPPLPFIVPVSDNNLEWNFTCQVLLPVLLHVLHVVLRPDQPRGHPQLTLPADEQGDPSQPDLLGQF